MKEIIYNYDNLKDNDINEVVIRIKALIINDNNILIGNESSIYQFPGGHLEENETFIKCLKREVLEETGIEIDDNDEIIGPIMRVKFLNKDWPKEGINRKSEIYYYVIYTNKNVNLSKTQYTEHEKENNYKIELFPISEVIDRIKENIPNNEKNKNISPDMISVIEEYLSNYNKM